MSDSPTCLGPAGAPESTPAEPVAPVSGRARPDGRTLRGDLSTDPR